MSLCCDSDDFPRTTGFIVRNCIVLVQDVLSGYLQRGRQPAMYMYMFAHVHVHDSPWRASGLVHEPNLVDKPRFVTHYAAPSISQFWWLRTAKDVLHQDYADPGEWSKVDQHSVPTLCSMGQAAHSSQAWFGCESQIL